MIGLEIRAVAELTCDACTAVSVSAVRPPPLVFPLPSNMTLHRLTELQSVLRPRWCRAVLQRLLLLCCLLLSGGCATQSYSCGSAAVWKTAPELAAITHPQIERGKPRPVIDGFGWVWGIPAKLILFDRRVENHAVSRETENAIAAYLQSNELDTVKVRLNQYRPGDDWKRLVANKSVGAGWRYTLGVLSVAGETLLPGRLFGGDHYNPFTNTIHVYSDVPAIAIHEGGHSKDFAGRTWKGTWAAAYLIPGVSLFHESIATGDAIGWLREYGDAEAQREGYNILYPAYGTYVGSAIGDPWGIGYIGGVLVGHAAGRWKSARVPDDPPQEMVAPDDAPESGESV